MSTKEEFEEFLDNWGKQVENIVHNPIRWKDKTGDGMRLITLVDRDRSLTDEDIRQEVLTNAWIAFKSFDSNRSNISGLGWYVDRCIKNRMLNFAAKYAALKREHDGRCDDIDEEKFKSNETGDRNNSISQAAENAMVVLEREVSKEDMAELIAILNWKRIGERNRGVIERAKEVVDRLGITMSDLYDYDKPVFNPNIKANGIE